VGRPVDLTLAKKVVSRGLDLMGGELAWENYHLAKDVLALAEQLEEKEGCDDHKTIFSIRLKKA
jgi:hypothetical protein